jgi:hypothetical protein
VAQLFLGAAGIEVYPLQVIGRPGKRIDARLRDIDPFSRAGCFANARDQVFRSIGNEQGTGLPGG